MVLSTHPLPCSAFEASGRATAEGQRDITLQFARRVQDDGSLKLVAVAASVERRSLTDKAALKGLALTHDDPDQPLALTADYSAKEAANDFLKWPALAATVKGKAVIQGCGVRHNSIDRDLTAHPQPGLTVTRRAAGDPSGGHDQRRRAAAVVGAAGLPAGRPQGSDGPR